MADFIASSLDNPFLIALQYLFEKLFEILFCRRLTLGSEVFKANTDGGFSKQTIVKKRQKRRFNNSKKMYLTKYS